MVSSDCKVTAFKCLCINYIHKHVNVNTIFCLLSNGKDIVTVHNYKEFTALTSLSFLNIGTRQS